MTQRSPAFPLKSCTSIDFGQIPSARGVEACTSTPLFPPAVPAGQRHSRRQHVVAELLVRLDVPGRLAGALEQAVGDAPGLGRVGPLLVEHRRPAGEVLAVEELNRLVLRRARNASTVSTAVHVKACLMVISSKKSGRRTNDPYTSPGWLDRRLRGVDR